MPPAPPGPEPRLRRVSWAQATRIVASRYPPIDLFERVSTDPAVWDALIAVEALVNPRVRDEVGEIHLVPPAERVCGPGASYVMAAFTHRNPKGSRFSDGSYGVYYAAREFRTALRETAHHFARFASDSRDGPRYEDMRVLVGRLDARPHDVASPARAEREKILDPESYAASQRFGAALRDADSPGLSYPSVRDPGGQCAAAFPSQGGRHPDPDQTCEIPLGRPARRPLFRLYDRELASGLALIDPGRNWPVTCAGRRPQPCTE